MHVEIIKENYQIINNNQKNYRLTLIHYLFEIKSLKLIFNRLSKRGGSTVRLYIFLNVCLPIFFQKMLRFW